MLSPKEIAKLPYRPCVGMLLLNSEDKVFVGRRIDTAKEGDNIWQMPQGGIDKGETPEAAVLREMEEEIGTDKAEIIAESRQWLHYDLPDHLVGKVWKGKYRGQKQRWFALRFLGQDSDIDLATEHPEFDAWRWVELEDAPGLVIPFKRDTYRAVVSEFRDLLGRN
ncbi:RNA pyrophosphohydrolase [Pelagibius marinus]|uniref:RNA pyrophosphohydrolase n=1 Tax=Pelagibius marinus TaxID=2762760 RepID=UPI00187251DD|nr:RNA pyrophosphohydrolase [Pelagibius marinus]